MSGKQGGNHGANRGGQGGNRGGGRGGNRGGQGGNRGGQGGQPPRGGKQGQQPRGGNQPPRGQSNQRQGGQPPGGQPPEDQPPAGQSGDDDSGDDETEIIKEWAIYLVALFGISGVGTGILWILTDAVDEAIFEADGVGAEFDVLLGQITVLTLTAALVLAAVFIGAWLGRYLDFDDQLTFKIAGAGVGGGTAVFLILAIFLISIALDDASLEFGGMLINTILASVVAGGIAAGGVWAARNQAPEDF